MKTNDLKPCARCNGKVYPMIYRVTVERLWIDHEKVNRDLGLAQILGGNLDLADVFSPHGSVVDTIDTNVADLCQDCALSIWSMVIDED